MMLYRLLGIGAAAAVGFAMLGASEPQAAAADGGGPPACAKILFRPLISGLNDGEQEAGIYTSRFGHIELKAMVKGGEPQDYYLTAKNKPLGALPGTVPPVAVECAKDKKMPIPSKAGASCTGQRFATVIAHSGKDKVALLYGLHDREWIYCGAGTLGGQS